MAVILGRSAWQALPPNWAVGEIQRVDDYVVHHSVTAQPTSIDESVGQVQAIQRDHLKETDEHGKPLRGDIAYNVIAGWNCAIVGRGPTRLDGATDTDPQTDTWSVCVLGDYTRDLLVPEIRAGLIEALLLGRQLYGKHPIRPHYDFHSTACPGEILAGELEMIARAVDIAAGVNQPEEPMTETEIAKLAQAIVDRLMAAPVTVHEYDKPGTPPYPTTFAGWLDFMHGEAQQTRLAQ